MFRLIFHKPDIDQRKNLRKNVHVSTEENNLLVFKEPTRLWNGWKYIHSICFKRHKLLFNSQTQIVNLKTQCLIKSNVSKIKSFYSNSSKIFCKIVYHNFLMKKPHLQMNTRKCISNLNKIKGKKFHGVHISEMHPFCNGIEKM